MALGVIGRQHVSPGLSLPHSGLQKVSGSSLNVPKPSMSTELPEVEHFGGGG